MEQLSFFENIGCTQAVLLKKHLYENVYDWSFYCRICGAFISHPRPPIHKGKTCRNCGRLITAVFDEEFKR